MFVIFNANNEAKEVTLPNGCWDVYINGEKAGTEVIETIKTGVATVEPISAMVLVKTEGEMEAPAKGDASSEKSGSVNKGVVAAGVAAVAAVIGGIIVFFRKKKK